MVFLSKIFDKQWQGQRLFIGAALAG